MTSTLLSTETYINSYPSWGDKFKDGVVDVTKLINVASDWLPLFKRFIGSKEFTTLNQFYEEWLKKTDNHVRIFPYPDLVFNAFSACSLGNTSVVLIGQDPYHGCLVDDDGSISPQAMGLSFSVPVGHPIPSSLKSVYRNLKKFGHLTRDPTHGNLESWCWQGVLLLNRALTVQGHKANSHKRKWPKFTDAVIRYISANTENVVFMLWGAAAQDLEPLIDTSKHCVLKSSHPSGLSCNNWCRGSPPFRDTDHFTNANRYLAKHGRKTITWGSVNLK